MMTSPDDVEGLLREVFRNYCRIRHLDPPKIEPLEHLPQGLIVSLADGTRIGLHWTDLNELDNLVVDPDPSPELDPGTSRQREFRARAWNLGTAKDLLRRAAKLQERAIDHLILAEVLDRVIDPDPELKPEPEEDPQ